MSQSLSQLYVHIVFHIKSNSCIIRNQEKKELYAYMGCIIKDNNSMPILINGVENHVHILCVMSKNIALSKLVEEIKRHSSRWIKKRVHITPSFHGKEDMAVFLSAHPCVEKQDDILKTRNITTGKLPLKKNI